MKSSVSLPSLLSESKLFSSEQELETARSEFKFRLTSDKAAPSSSEEQPPARRSLIHFKEDVEGFASFKTINTHRVDDILRSLKGMRSGKTNLGHTVKA